MHDIGQQKRRIDVLGRLLSTLMIWWSVKEPLGWLGSRTHLNIQPSQIGLNSLLAKCSFHTLGNYAQVDLIDLLIAANPG